MLHPVFLPISAIPTSSDPFNFTQLGIASIVCVLLLAALLWQSKQLLASQQRERTLLEEAKNRERELAEKTVPLLVETTRLLATLPERVDQVLDKMRNPSR